MRDLRIFLAEGAAAFLKYFVMFLYSAWALKLGLIDTSMNPLFALLMVPLSIYGLWVIVRKATAHVARLGGEADAVR